MEWLVNILHVEPPLLKEFVYITEYELKLIDKALKNPGKPGDHSSILKTLISSINNIISNVSFLDLNFFLNVAKKFLQEINQIKNIEKINSSDFIPLVMQFQELQHSLDEIKTLMNKFGHLQDTLRTTRRYEGGLLIKSINNLVDNLCKKLGKQIQFKYHAFDGSCIPYANQSLVKEFLVVLTRYSVFYGIEKPEERKSANKNPVGTIEISTFSTKRIFGFKFRHDGQLVRMERLLQNTIESKDNYENKSQLGSEVIKLLFIPSNFPSNLNEAEQSKEVFLNMELAKKKLKMHGGKMKITFTSEKYCEYTISFYKK
jgi:chemotaxis protein histidine kinase CheA